MNGTHSNHLKAYWSFRNGGPIILLIAVTLGCGPSRSTPPPTRKLNVGIATFPGHGPGFIAKERGFFGDLQVEFPILDDFTARQNAFTSGATDLTISTI